MKESLEISLTVARKELKVVLRRRSIVIYIIALPLLLAVAFTLVVQNDIVSSSGIVSDYQLGLESLTYFFVLLAAVLPASIAAYSIVGEKIEKSLEPLLATPVTDGEILLGKSVAAFAPPILSTWAGASIFMASTDYLTHGGLSYNYFPNWDSGIMLLLLAPLGAVLSIEVAVIASSRVNDVRSANQIAGLMYIPFMGVFIAATTGVINLGVGDLLIFSLILLILDVVAFFLSKSTFGREEILTKWK